jgi:hypothetical protein
MVAIHTQRHVRLIRTDVGRKALWVPRARQTGHPNEYRGKTYAAYDNPSASPISKRVGLVQPRHAQPDGGMAERDK